MNGNHNDDVNTDHNDVNANQMRGVSSITMLMREVPSAGFFRCFLFSF